MVGLGIAAIGARGLVVGRECSCWLLRGRWVVLLEVCLELSVTGGSQLGLSCRPDGVKYFHRCFGTQGPLLHARLGDGWLSGHV